MGSDRGCKAGENSSLGGLQGCWAYSAAGQEGLPSTLHLFIVCPVIILHLLVQRDGLGLKSAYC